MTIDSEAEKLTDIFDAPVSYWGKFKLSLPGRIAIANTFLLSQINHLGCFLSPRVEQIEKIQKTLDDFCM